MNEFHKTMSHITHTRMSVCMQPRRERYRYGWVARRKIVYRGQEKRKIDNDLNTKGN